METQTNPQTNPQPATKTPSTKKARLPQTRRVAAQDLPPLSLMKRDGEIVRAIAEYRALTTPQISRLLFAADEAQTEGVSSRCFLRLKLLYHHGYVQRVEQPQILSEGRKPFMYFLDTKGAELLEDLDGDRPDWRKKDNELSAQKVEHLMYTNNIRIAIATSARRNGFTLEEWIDDKALKSAQMKDTVTVKNDAGGTAKTAIVPDGYFRLVVPAPEGKRRIYHHFLECDMGTMTAIASVWGRRDYRHKILAYTAYYNSGKYEARYQAKTLKVLTVTTSEARLRTLRTVTEQAGGKNRFWFTTFERMKGTDILVDHIWDVATREGLCSLTEVPPVLLPGESS